jgi:NADH-quinone oxidoreductase subunit F
MARLTTIAELDALRRRIRDRLAHHPTRITVCAGTACQASGANDLQRVLKRRLMEGNLADRIALRITGCHGFCEMGPFAVTEPGNAFYPRLDAQHVPDVIAAVLDGACAEHLLYRDPVTGVPCRRLDAIPFYARQHRVLLAQNQHVDPIRLFGYIAQGGYAALATALGLAPEEIIAEIGRAGLRGRGGAGFPTADKWAMARRQHGVGPKYVVCNADEGDPGAYMDRSILEGNPHSVVEGMIIGALAIGASGGFIFVRQEYPLAIKHVLIALRVAREYGLLGRDILGSGVDFDVSIVKSAGAFVCGEETALIRTIEGVVGEPRQRPPFPVERGIDGRPTCINNVETWANVPIILANGGAAYARVGTATSTGTKVFSVVGKIRHTGLVEVPMGTTIREIVYDIGGGALDGRRIKAVQIGGPSGGCLPSERFDLPIDYDSLKGAGAIMGSGGMIVMDDDTCMVDVAKYFMGFLKDESCGKCFTCRKGTQRMWELLDDITAGRGTLAHLDLLEELGETVATSSMCGLGRSAPNPVLSSLRYFRREYERHIIDKRCDAYVCKGLIGAPCQAACPVGTEAWRYAAHIAEGDYEAAYRTIREANPFPSVCARVCDHRCERHCRLGTMGGDPVALRALKRFVTDRVDPRVYRPPRHVEDGAQGKRVAIVGAGPAGLTAAHRLSLKGYRSTVFEADDVPGGMLRSGIPSYRLPRDVLQREIDALLDHNITLLCGTALGRDFTLDDLLDDGYDAVFVATGAHRCRRLGLDGEDATGVLPSLTFLKAWNLRGDALARGRVGVIGGGNAAVDAARVARRQPGVSEVTLLYRRTRAEMPAFPEEVEAALEEGVRLVPLVSPVRLLRERGRIVGVELIENALGEVDAGGRRAPVPKPRSEYTEPVDTLVVAIGEVVGDVTAALGPAVETRAGAVMVDRQTLATGRPGVFAGGDVATGPTTVIDAIAAGKRAADAIGRYLRGVALSEPSLPCRPTAYVAPAPVVEDPSTGAAHEATLPVEERIRGFAEVMTALTPADAAREARRCLRCDLDFTQEAAHGLRREGTGA